MMEQFDRETLIANFLREAWQQGKYGYASEPPWSLWARTSDLDRLLFPEDHD